MPGTILVVDDENNIVQLARLYLNNEGYRVEAAHDGKQALEKAKSVRPDLIIPGLHREERAVVPIPGLNRAVVQAVNVARSISPDVRAVYISDDAIAAADLRERFERQLPGVPLVVVESPYRVLADRKSTRLNSSHPQLSRMPSSA